MCHLQDNIKLERYLNGGTFPIEPGTRVLATTGDGDYITYTETDTNPGA